MSKKPATVVVPEKESHRIGEVFGRITLLRNQGRKLTEKGQQYAEHLDNPKVKGDPIRSAFEAGL
jgi:hypothetical protein